MSEDERITMQYLHMIESVRRNWQWFLLFGILLVILGMVAIGSSAIATLFSVVFLGSLLVIGGVTQLIHAIWTREWSGFFLSIVLGLFYTVAGLLFIMRPETSAISLTLFIGAFCLIGGLFRLITSLAVRFDHWGWVCFNGLVTFLLGVLIISDWPISGLWVIGLFLGVDLILIGWSWILMALAVRSHNKRI
jgi:uncharacterized membrane protein HdeD (DUF308 family)